MSATHWTDKLQMCGLFHWQQLWLIGGLQLSRAHSTISKVLIKSFWPVEEFLDHENLEYCRLPKNFEFMIIVFCIMYANIMINLGSVAFKLWIIVYTLKVLSIELHLLGSLWECDPNDHKMLILYWWYDAYKSYESMIGLWFMIPY